MESIPWVRCASGNVFKTSVLLQNFFTRVFFQGILNILSAALGKEVKISLKLKIQFMPNVHRQVNLLFNILFGVPHSLTAPSHGYLQQFFMDCYTPLGELMDMMALVNCALNFILYCLMSRQFRLLLPFPDPIK